MADAPVNFLGAAADTSQQSPASSAALSVNQGFNGNVAQEWLRRSKVVNFEPELVFPNFCISNERKAGYRDHSFWRAQRVATSAVTETTSSGIDNTGSTIGSTPDSISIKAGKIVIQPKQYVTTHKFSDMIESYNVIDWADAMMAEVMNATGRKVDDRTQDVIYAAATGTGGNIRYAPAGSTAITSLNSYTATNALTAPLKLTHVATAFAFLKNKSAKMFPALNSFVGIIHPAVQLDLMKETTSNAAWVDISKHTPEMVMRIVRGYIGTIYGVSIVCSANVQTKASTGTGTPKVYPSYFLSYGAVAKMNYLMRSYIVTGASKSDPANQRRSVSVKAEYNAKIIQPEGYIIFLSGTGDNL